ncbi:MAG TPA: hypothetical protein ENN29_08380 [Candidatus Hydrogenedentes bacterium]|nr:hypothetical protein [Candidatus Hydrogenedentota bacterium]
MSDNTNKDEQQPNYDIPAIISEYVSDLLPDDEEWDETTEEEIENEVAWAFFICVTAWNHAALPADCAAIYLAQAEEAFCSENGLDMWNEAKSDVLNMAANMGERYPTSDHIIIDHELESLDDGAIGLAIDIIPIDEAIVALRETN